MLFIKNARIKPIHGEEQPNSSILIQHQKIAAIGPEIVEPPNAEVIDAGGRLLTPGCIDAHCHIGVDNLCLRWEGMDYNESSDPITPQLRGIDSVNPQDPAFHDALRGGVTAACTGPGSANVVGGTFAVLKLAGDCVDRMILKDPVAMKCAFGENPKDFHGQRNQRSPMTRMGIAALLRGLLLRTKRYRAEQLSGKNPPFDMKLEAMIPVLEHRIPLKCHVHRADDIFTAIRIAREFDLAITLDHCTEGGLIAQELAQEEFPVLVGPLLGERSKPEVCRQSVATPYALWQAGLKVSIITDAPVIPIELLPLCAGLAVREGLSEQEAWRAITINPAEALGVADRIGSLEVGKDADLVVWTADPLKVVGGEAFLTIVDGQIVYRAG